MKPSTSLYTGSIAAFLFVLAGCAAGPNYKAPRAEVPSAFANATQPGIGTNQPVTQWWHDFHDSQLDELVSRALARNYDLRSAVATLREARALRRQAQFDLLPSANVDASYAHSLNSQALAPGVPRSQRELELYDAGFDATWELDIFGRVRRSVEATSAEVQAAEASLRDVRISTVSEVVRNYCELRGAQHELQVALQNAENQRETLKITVARLEGGRGTELDAARARAQLNVTLAGVPPIETSIARSIHRLGVLTGQNPESVITELKEPRSMPQIPALAEISDPAALLRRRPDIRIAERRLAAATARIGVQTADLFPRVTFNGRVGFEASSLSGLGGAAADTWNFGPRITWAALDLGHVLARIHAARARAEGVLALYQRTVLDALEETENALVNYGREQARLEFLKASVDASQQAANLARERFDNGATDFLTVLDAQRVLLEAQNQLAQTQTRAITSLVAVYKALGAGPNDENRR